MPRLACLIPMLDGLMMQDWLSRHGLGMQHSGGPAGLARVELR